jgi:uncharacterized repeat protein (TIGR04138 family)
VSASEQRFWDTVDRIRDADGRYRREAYGFVVGALGATVQALPPERLADTARRHLSGGELLRGIVRLARTEFGAMAPTVFREWGVTAGEDVGNIVFHLVERGELSARPEDTLDDFRGFDLMGALGARLEIGRLRAAAPAHGQPGRGSGGPG